MATHLRHRGGKKEDVDRVEEQSEYSSLRVLRGEISSEEYLTEIMRKKERHLDLRQLATEYLIPNQPSRPTSRNPKK